MRTKNCVISLFIICMISLGVIIFGQQKPDAIQSIVSSTNEQIRNFKDNLRDAETKTLLGDQKLLDALGFSESPRLYPEDVWRNTSLPVVVTYVLERQESLAVGLVLNVSRVLPNNTILVYNLGLSDYGLKTLQSYCNNSRCQVITVDLYDFPSHISDEVLHAYRPVVIQDALSRVGAILFMESSYRFMHNVTQTIIMNLYENVVLSKGILTFPFPQQRNPVTSLTHKKMFDYFRTDAENFQFLQMVQANAIFLVNTKEVHQDIMLPWVKCALTQDCVFPIGAQSVGCKFDKRPFYRYSGCHYFDASALNIVLGLKFKFISNEYSYRKPFHFFTDISLKRADDFLKELEQNDTTDGHLSVPS